tara:strand:- start:1497 stop:1796 length:300 start_codon:yes stop_codon:yes gene_type:complete
MKNGVEFTVPKEKKYINYVTKIAYTGKNLDILKKTGYDGEFITFNQTFSIGGIVPKETKTVASLVRFLNNENPKKPQFKRFSVFHVSQVELPELKNKEE